MFVISEIRSILDVHHGVPISTNMVLSPTAKRKYQGAKHLCKTKLETEKKINVFRSLNALRLDMVIYIKSKNSNSL